MNNAMAALQEAYQAYEELSKSKSKHKLDSFDTFVKAMKRHKSFGSEFGESEIRAIYWWLREHNLMHETEGVSELAVA